MAPRGTPGGVVDDALATHGLARRVALMVPNFLVAPHIIAATDLVVTIAERLARAFAAPLPLQVLAPPLPLPGFAIAMSWHERQHRDPGHVWLREQMVAVAGRIDVVPGSQDSELYHRW